MQFARLTPGVKVFFFVPHSDDLEFGPAITCVEALRLGCDVTEVVATNSAFGTKRQEFKGERLYRIRKKELERTLDVYKSHVKNELKLLRLEYTDGSLPLDEKAINRVMALIQEKKPDVVFTPDPVYSVDYHPDHLNTGRLVYFAIKRMEPRERPKHLFFFYTFKPNFGISCHPSNIKTVQAALREHRSQIAPGKVDILTKFKKLSLMVNFRRVNAFVDTFRHLSVQNEGFPDQNDSIRSIKDKMLYSLFYKWMAPLPPEFYKPAEDGKKGRMVQDRVDGLTNPM